MAQGWAAVYPSVKFYDIHLEALALEVLNLWNPEKNQAYLLADAFAGQVFIQSFVKTTSGFEYDGVLQLKDRNALNELNSDAAIVDDLGFLKKKQTWPQSWVWFDGVFPHAKWVYRAGLKTMEASDIHQMDVRYLKATSAELKWQEKEKK
jgi:tRNA A37 threonylcarbamoyladenosine modification protein TsaB